MSRRINGMNKSNLELYLKSKGYTIKDLKAESTLIFCLNLINEYINGELTETSSYSNDYNISYEDRIIIFASMLEIRDYLITVVLSADKLQDMLKCQDTKIDKMKARLIEPQSYFYNVIAKKFHSKLNSLFEEENKYYIPEQLVVYTIIEGLEVGLDSKGRYLLGLDLWIAEPTRKTIFVASPIISIFVEDFEIVYNSWFLQYKLKYFEVNNVYRLIKFVSRRN